MDSSRTRVELEGVPETMLWTLYHRAHEARRPDAVLHDPRAIALVDAIDYPFEARFGTGPARDVVAQGQALRCRCFDDAVRRFAAERPGGTVVALGEGLETQAWRVDDGRVRWLTVDLPEAVALRRRLLPEVPRGRVIAGSAFDAAWMDAVDGVAGRDVLVTAQGVLMYHPPADVHRLLTACSRRFGSGALVFDTVPRWFSALTLGGTLRVPGGYRPPPMPWGIDAGELPRLREVHPAIAEVRDLGLPRGRGALLGRLAPPLLTRVPVARSLRPAIALARFGDPP